MRGKFRKRRRARYSRRRAIVRGRDEQARGVRAARARGGECRRVSLETLALRPVPALDGARRPLRALVLVAIVAGVRRARAHAFVGPRNAEAVIVPVVDHHIGAHRHMAVRAGHGLGRRLVTMVRGGGELLGRMALQADAVARIADLGAVRIVTIAARHARGEHAALLERAVVENLVVHLPGGIIEPARQVRHRMGVRQPASWNPVLRELPASRMAHAAALHLRAQGCGRRASARAAGLSVDRPGHVEAFGIPHQKSEGRVVLLAERQPALVRARPCGVSRSLSMAGFAADRDFGKCRLELVRRRVVVLAHAGRVTLGAHEVPVLVQLRPVQHVGMIDVLVWIEMKPALSASFAGPRVPRERQRLHASIGKLDEILLQGLEAERVLDFESRELAVRPIRFDHELAVPAKHARAHAEILEPRIVEVAEHALLARMGHRLRMLRLTPQIGLPGVARRAGFTADKARRRVEVGMLKRRAQRGRLHHQQQRGEQDGRDHRRRCDHEGA